MEKTVRKKKNLRKWCRESLQKTVQTRTTRPATGVRRSFWRDSDETWGTFPCRSALYCARSCWNDRGPREYRGEVGWRKEFVSTATTPASRRPHHYGFQYRWKTIDNPPHCPGFAPSAQSLFPVKRRRDEGKCWIVPVRLSGRLVRRGYEKASGAIQKNISIVARTTLHDS